MHESEVGARHGVAAPRGLAAPPGARGSRFTTMFADVKRRDPGERAIEALVQKLHALPATTAAGQHGRIRAGYTYLAQFIDHDVTFDPTSKIDGVNDPDALVNFRTPRLDLDSVYGSGPADQPFLYDWDCDPYSGAKLLVGRNPPEGHTACVDLPRNHQGRALIGDARNDENLIVSQLHLLFIKFHNSVVEHVHAMDASLTTNALFDEAHRTVRWHFQWIVAHDFLKQVVGDDVWKSVQARLQGGAPAATAAARGWAPDWEPPAIPVEFSAAAYRFGHSMVRRDYSVAGHGSVPILPNPDQEDGRHLSGFRRLPAALEIEWRFFFGEDPAQKSMLIDHRLNRRLLTLPPDGMSLVRLNLQRGRALDLPDGRAVARSMGVRELTDDELFPQAETDSDEAFWPEDGSCERKKILEAPPLWFYVLREASARGDGGRHLGDVGGRIVAETIVGLLEADETSYLHAEPAWTPTLADGDWNEMTDLVRFTLAGDDDHHGH